MAGRKADDEYYTRREDVEAMLKPLLDMGEFAGKRILCPCDTEQSQYIQFFQDNGIDVTWDDRLDYDLFDFAAYDGVITNPPFSRSADFTRKIIEANKKAGTDFHFLCSYMSLTKAAVLDIVMAGRGHVESAPKGRPFKFVKPDGSLKSIATAIVSSYPQAILQPPLVRLKDPEYAADGTPIYSHLPAIPEKWDGAIGVPGGFLYMAYDPSIHKICGAINPVVNGRKMFTKLLVEYVA